MASHKMFIVCVTRRDFVVVFSIVFNPTVPKSEFAHFFCTKKSHITNLNIFNFPCAEYFQLTKEKMKERRKERMKERREEKIYRTLENVAYQFASVPFINQKGRQEFHLKLYRCQAFKILGFN